MTPLIQKTLKHFAILAALGAASTLVAGVVIFLAGFNIATLPVTYQVFAAMLVPMIVSALKQAQTELDAELAAAQAAQTIKALSVK